MSTRYDPSPTKALSYSEYMAKSTGFLRKSNRLSRLRLAIIKKINESVENSEPYGKILEDFKLFCHQMENYSEAMKGFLRKRRGAITHLYESHEAFNHESERFLIKFQNRVEHINRYHQNTLRADDFADRISAVDVTLDQYEKVNKDWNKESK